MSHLKIVKDEPPKPKRRKYERLPLLSAEDERRFRAALAGLRNAFSTWRCLAAAMDVRVESLTKTAHGRRSVSGDMIVKAMKASGLTFAELFGGPVAADRCRACGRVRAA